MPVVQTFGSLVELETQWTGLASTGSLQLYDSFYHDYATLYARQPNVRTCVDFLARNIAQLGLHVFRRLSETDRERLRDHGLAQTLERPLPPAFKVTRYRLIESLVADLGIYFNAYWLKVRLPGDDRVGLMRVPPSFMSVYGGLFPQRYELRMGSVHAVYTPDQVMHFRGYNPDPTSGSCIGVSPLETLRRVLAEEHAAGDYREYFWQNGARMGGVIKRPLEAPKWSLAARDRFKAEFEGLYSGAANSGKTAILEEGMEWQEMTFNAQESEYLAGRKLTREECARAYHIPLPLVGILDHATFSNVKEQHKHLYQDCLGPQLAMIEQEIMLQLLPEFPDSDGVYVEFNIAEKLSGSFEEQTEALQRAIGRAWMTPDEGRAKLNLPSLGGDAEELGTPLNVLIGGQANPRDAGPKAAPSTGSGPSTSSGAGGVGLKAASVRIDPELPEMRRRYEEKWTAAMVRTFRRQMEAVLAAAGAGVLAIGMLWDVSRWNKELGTDLLRLNVATAMAWARHVAELIELELDEERMLPWLENTSRIAAEEINATTSGQVAAALADEDPKGAIRAAFEVMIAVRAAQIGVSAVTRASVFGAQEAARQGKARSKTWRVHSGNPRDAHAAMAGETVPIDGTFSNGMLWPGDPAGGAENNSNCQCSVSFDFGGG